MEYEKRARQLEREAERLEEHSEEVGGRIGSTRRDWEDKLADSEVPGAQDEETAAIAREEVPPEEEDTEESGEGVREGGQ